MPTNQPRTSHTPFRSFETCVCGAVITPDSHFCRYCGAALEHDAAKAPEAADSQPHPNGSAAPVADTPADLAPPVANTSSAEPIATSADTAATSPDTTSATPSAATATAPADTPTPADNGASPVAEPDTPAVEFDFEAVDRAESRHFLMRRLLPLSVMGAGLIVLLAWGIGQNRRQSATVAPPLTNAAAPVPEQIAVADNAVGVPAPAAAQPSLQLPVSNATPRAGAPATGARPTPAHAIPPAGVTRHPSLPLPAPPLASRVPSGVDSVDTGGVSSGGGPYAPGSGRAPVTRVNSGQIPRMVGREEGVGTRIRDISAQLRAGTGDAADLHLQRGNLYMQSTENELARADYNAAITIYNDRIKRGVRVEESRTGIATAQRGLQMLP